MSYAAGMRRKEPLALRAGADWFQLRCGPAEKATYLVAMIRSMIRSDPTRSEEMVQLIETELRAAIGGTLVELARRCEIMASDYRGRSTCLEWMPSPAQVRSDEAAADALDALADEIMREAGKFSRV